MKFTLNKHIFTREILQLMAKSAEILNAWIVNIRFDENFISFDLVTLHDEINVMLTCNGNALMPKISELLISTNDTESANKIYELFKQLIRRDNMGKIDRTGEENVNNFGSKMIISEYNNKDDIDVYFP